MRQASCCSTDALGRDALADRVSPSTGRYGGKPPVASPNHLERRFNVTDPNKVWVTYIRTYEGWLYLAVVLDLFSRQVSGWSMKPQMTSDLAIDALLMAV